MLALGDRNDTNDNAKDTTRVTPQGQYTEHAETTMLRYEIDQNYESRLRIIRANLGRFVIDNNGEDKSLPMLCHPSNEGGAKKCPSRARTQLMKEHDTGQNQNEERGKQPTLC
jgi:hypothetical protein